MAANELTGTGGTHAMLQSTDGADFMTGPICNRHRVVPAWNTGATLADTTLTMMTPLTTNVFVYSLQQASTQSNGQSQEQASILKSVPLTLIEQTILIGTLRGFELAGIEDGDQHRPSRAVYYTS